MARICDNCGKHGHSGRQHTHHPGVAGGQWKKRAPVTLRRFMPNLHWVTLPVGGRLQRMKLCTRCIKRLRFEARP